ncbi:MAG: sortase [Candidatus Blackburnbacteria bacterium]|nr:sortase [Candidatus Blackburnbacteria bacterium]
MLFTQKPIYGVIYDASWGQTSGEVVVVTGQGITLTIPYEKFLAARENLLSSDLGVGVIRGVGAGLVTLGIAGVVITTKPIIASEFSYQTNKAKNLVQQKVANTEYMQNIKKAQEEAQQREYAQQFAAQVGAPNTDFSVYIPKIDAKAPIIANVDSAIPDTYMEALKKGVAHAYGSSYPDQPGGTYVFAHSTNGPWNVSRYNAVFYLLRELDAKTQDEVYVFYQGKVYKYKVAEKHVVDGDDLSWLLNAREGDQRLILQTCWPPGTVWKRIVVVAYPDKSESQAASPLSSATSVYGGSIN